MQRRKAISKLHAYADSLLAEQGSTTATVSPVAVARPRSLRWRSPSVALASMGFMVFGNIGMAAAVNSSVPGDLLYPVDRAYESLASLVGMDGGGPTERLQEASVLLARGDFELAVDTIAGAIADVDDELATSVAALSPGLAQLDARNVKREDLHRAVAALVETARGVGDGATGPDRATQRQAVKDSARVVAETARGGPFVPPGLDDDFTPPGLDDDFTPPGLDDDFTPPGLDDDFTPPGLDDDFTPPGLDDDSTPPGLDDKPTPPGLDDKPTPPGLDDDSTPPGLDDKPTPPGLDDKPTPPGQAKDIGTSN